MARGFEFAPYRVDLADARLFRGDTPLGLRPKTFAVLCLLLERHGKLVSKQELLDTVWSDVAVGDAVLKGCIRELRDALGDDPSAPRYVETAHRLGYRFIAPLTASEVQPSTRPAGAGGEPATRPHAAERTDEELVGRDAELQGLHEALGRARLGERQTVLIEGEPGAGKSTLLNALVARAKAAEVRVLAAHCIDQFGAGEPFMPILEALEAHGGDAAEVAVRAETGAPLAGSAAGLVRSLAQGIEKLAGSAGLVLVVEDLHWSDPSTLALIALLAHRGTKLPLLMAMSYRPVRDEPEQAALRSLLQELTARGRATRIVLSGLAPEAVRTLLTRRSAEVIPIAELAAVIHARTGGNALFVSALLDDLVVRGLLSGERGHALLDEVHAQLPGRLSALVTARLCELGAAERRLVELLAVAAVPLHARALAALLDADVVATEALCEALCQHRWLGREPGSVQPGAPRYVIVHALVLDAAYALVPSERRRALHRRVAAHLGRIALEETRELAHVLALHLERAGELLRAADACARAAAQAGRRYAPREACLHAERGLRLVAEAPRAVSSDPIELRLQLARGSARMALYGTADQELAAIFERARELAREIDDDAHRGRALLGLQGYYGVRDLSLSCELADEVLRIATDTGDVALESEGEMARGLADFYRGRLAQAERHYERAERAMAVRRAAADPEAGAESAALSARRAIVSQLRGEPERALAQAESALASVDRRDDFAQRARVLVLKSWLHLLRGEPVASARDAEGALGAAERDGLLYWEAGARVMRGAARLASDDVHGAIDDLTRGLAGWRRLGAGLLYTYFSAVHGAALVRLGRVDEALSALARAERATATIGEQVMASEILRLRAGYVEQRAPDEALGQLAAGAALALEQGAVQLRLSTLTDLLSLARRLERHELVRRAEADLRALCQGLGSDAGFQALRAARLVLGSAGAARASSELRLVVSPRTA